MLWNPHRRSSLTCTGHMFCHCLSMRSLLLIFLIATFIPSKDSTEVIQVSLIESEWQNSNCYMPHFEGTWLAKTHLLGSDSLGRCRNSCGNYCLFAIRLPVGSASRGDSGNCGRSCWRCDGGSWGWIISSRIAVSVLNICLNCYSCSWCFCTSYPWSWCRWAILCCMLGCFTLSSSFHVRASN